MILRVQCPGFAAPMRYWWNKGDQRLRGACWLFRICLLLSFLLFVLPNFILQYHLFPDPFNPYFSNTLLVPVLGCLVQFLFEARRTCSTFDWWTISEGTAGQHCGLASLEVTVGSGHSPKLPLLMYFILSLSDSKFITIYVLFLFDFHWIVFSSNHLDLHRFISSDLKSSHFPVLQHYCSVNVTYWPILWFFSILVNFATPLSFHTLPGSDTAVTFSFWHSPLPLPSLHFKMTLHKQSLSY